jgi:hypothetical protein
VVNTCGAEDGYHNKTYGAKSLNEYLGVEVDKTCGICSLESVNAYTRKLEKHSFLKVKIVYYEIGRSLTSDKKVGCEPACKGLSIAVRDKTEHALLVAKVGVGRLIAANEALAAADNGGNDLVTYLDGLTFGIHLYVLTESDDLTRALVAKRYGNNSKRVAFPFVNVCTTNATTFNFN